MKYVHVRKKKNHSVRNKRRHGDSYAALVHAGLVELMLLDREGNILQKDTLTMEDLNSDKISEIQVNFSSITCKMFTKT